MLLLAWLAVPLPVANGRAAELEPAPDDPSAGVIARRAEAGLRGSRTYMEATLRVARPRARSRLVSFRSWDDRAEDRALIRVRAPDRHAGTTFLRLPPNLWRFVPSAGSTERIAPSLLLSSWMGSDFTIDDLFHQTSAVDDYEHRLLGIDPAPEGAPELRAWVVEYVPHAEGPQTWGRIVAWIETEHATPLRRDFYDRQGNRVRTERFGEIRQVGRRRVPHLRVMTSLGEKGHETRLQVEKILFDTTFEAGIFSTRNLKQQEGADPR